MGVRVGVVWWALEWAWHGRHRLGPFQALEWAWQIRVRMGVANWLEWAWHADALSQNLKNLHAKSQHSSFYGYRDLSIHTDGQTHRHSDRRAWLYRLGSAK